MAEPNGRAKRARAPSLAVDTSLNTLLQCQTQSITALHGWLDDRQADTNCGEIVSTIKEHLSAHKELVLGARQTSSWPTSSPSCWGPVRCSRASPDSPIFSITGPSREDSFEVTAATLSEAPSVEKFVDCLSEMSEDLATGEAQIRRVIQIRSEIDELQLSGAPQATVQTHIRLLQQYNDIKDIGQQLIGLVAENRGVPIGSLYQSGQYGVTRED